MSSAPRGSSFRLTSTRSSRFCSSRFKPPIPSLPKLRFLSTPSFPPPPLPRTNRTSLVPPLVLTGHAASLTPYYPQLSIYPQPAPAPAAHGRPHGVPLLHENAPRENPPRECPKRRAGLYSRDMGRGNSRGGGGHHASRRGSTSTRPSLSARFSASTSPCASAPSPACASASRYTCARRGRVKSLCSLARASSRPALPVVKRRPAGGPGGRCMLCWTLTVTRYAMLDAYHRALDARAAPCGELPPPDALLERRDAPP